MWIVGLCPFFGETNLFKSGLARVRVTSCVTIIGFVHQFIRIYPVGNFSCSSVLVGIMIKATRMLLVCLFVLSLVALTKAIEESSTATNYAKQDETVKGLIDWMIAKGGYIHPQVQIRRWDRSDPTSYFGVFVDHAIEKDELLIKIPVAIKLQVDDKLLEDFVYTDMLCELAWLLKKEYELGEKSEYAPYTNYVKEQSKYQLPAMWSDAGKELLKKVQGDLEMTGFLGETESGEHMVNWIEDWFEGEACLVDDESDQQLELFYLALATQRGYDYALLPIFDMINHHNGNVNTETRPSIFDNEGFGIYALRDLEKGEELFYSYHDCPDCRACPDCDSTLSYWGTPEMLRDFGFVEPYPHRFHLEEDEEELTLVIEEKPEDKYSYYVTCVDGRCPSLTYAQKHVDRLAPMHDNDILPAKNRLPPHEYYNIDQYHDALHTAFVAFVTAIDEDDSEDEEFVSQDALRNGDDGDNEENDANEEL
jgi:hypothetical protein